MQQVTIVLSQDANDKGYREYKAWMPAQSSVGRVVNEAMAYWNYGSSSAWASDNWTALDQHSNQVPRDLTLEYLDAQTLPYPDIAGSKDQLQFTLHLAARSMPQQPPVLPPLSPADQILQIFLVHALQNPWGQGWRINWQQFKALTKYTMLSSSPGSSLAWDTQKMLAFKGHASCSLGLTYPEFLLALAHLLTATPSTKPTNLDLPSLHTVILESTATSTASLRTTMRRLQHYDHYANVCMTSTLLPFTKPLHALLSAFRVPGAPPNLLSFAEFRAFVAAVRLKTTTHVTMQQLAAVFVHAFRMDVMQDAGAEVKPFHHVHVPIPRLIGSLVHVGMCGVPRLLGLATPGDAALHDHLAQHTIGHEYAATCVKIVLQEITQALQPLDINAICARLPASSADSFRHAAGSLHRVFLTVFQADGAIDYVARCRALVATAASPQRQPQKCPEAASIDAPITKPQLHHQTNHHQVRRPPPQHPLDRADDLLDAIVVEVTDMGDQVDVDFIATQWLAAVDTYERFVATQIASGNDHHPFLLRYATTLTVFAQQLWSYRAVADILELAVEAVRVGGVTFHANWAGLCIASHHTKDASTDLAVLTCVLQWAHCLQLHGDLVSHQTCHAPDPRLHVSPGLSSPNPVGTSQNTIELWSIAPSATAAELYNEAWWRYLVAVTICPSDANVVNCVITQLHLALHLPSGCGAAKDLFHDALDRLASLEAETEDASALEVHIHALLFVRHAFLRPSAPPIVTPFYSYVLAALFTSFSTTGTGLSPSDLNRLNAACSLPPLTPSTIEWLQATFECTAEGHVTQAGLVQYFIYFATSDPIGFHAAFQLCTCDLDDSPRVPTQCFPAIRQHPSNPIAAPSRTPPSSFHRRRSSRSRDTFPAFALDHTSDTIADCFVVFSGVVAPMTQQQLDNSVAATDVHVVVQITDKLYHPNINSFRVPDEIATFLYPAPVTVQTSAPPPRWLDTVLTDVKGNQIYASCLQFVHPTTAAALLGLLGTEMSGGEVSTVAPPSWLDDHSTFYLPKCLCFLSRRPTFKSLHIALLQVFRSQHIQSKVISAFLNVPIPTTKDMKTICTLHSHTFMIHHHPQSFSPNEIDFALVFQRLSLPHIVEVLAYLVCEKKVAIAAKCVAMLTPVLETLRALVHPCFVSQVVYIPIVPEHLGDFLCSPVPFVVGLSVNQLHRAQLDNLDDVIFVNLDTNTITVPPKCPLPRLPEGPKKKLVKALSAYCERATIAVRDDKHHVDDNSFDPLYGQVDLDDDVSDSSTDDVAWRNQQCAVAAHIDDVWSGLQELVTDFFRSMVRDVKKYCHQGPTQPHVQFDSKGYLRVFSATRDFCAHLFETQQFQQFITREVRELQSPPHQHHPPHQLDQDAPAKSTRLPSTAMPPSQPRPGVHFVVANITD